MQCNGLVYLLPPDVMQLLLCP